MESSPRPRVFVSSTIYDFRDLRSAIEYWLEELGLQVEMSEATDFSRRPNHGAFQSCFGVIARCDFYVLLVGGRRGQWYVKDEVSVTQQEYRMAVDLAKQGGIKIVVLAREQVQGALREWKLMGKPLGREGRQTKDRLTIEDPEFTDAFLEEIKKTELEAKGNDPTGVMWIYSFRDFRDVTEVLRNNLQLYGSIARNVLLSNIRWELLHNIAAIYSKTANGLLFPGYRYFEDLQKNVTLSSARLRPGEQIVDLSPKQASDVITFAVFGAPMENRFRTAELNNAISSGEFFSYRQSTGRLEPTPALDVMISLRSEIETYQQSYGWWWQTNMNRVVEELRQGIQLRRPQISELDLALLMGMYQWLVNIERLSISLFNFIEDPKRGIAKPSLAEAKPYGKEDAEKARAEAVLPQDIEAWLTLETTQRNLT